MDNHALHSTTRTTRSSAAVAGSEYAHGGLLKFALTLDGVITGANGIVLLAGAPVLDGWLGLPASLLVAVGAFLTVYGALVLRLASRPIRAAVITVIAANVLWAADTLLALALDWHEPTLAGQVVIAVQAVGCAAFAALQYLGLRRS
jgi:hypothetical protein